MEDREMRVREGVREREQESERKGARKRRGPEMGPGSGASSMGTLTSGGDMTRHAGSAQLGQFAVLPCCFGFSSPNTQTHTHAHSFMGSRTLTHTQNAMDLARAVVHGRARALD